jgi:hypothetical protein
MTQVESERRSTFAALQAVESRLAVLRELLARFDLLARHYRSDIERLAAMIEAGQRFENLELATCPLCNSLLARADDSLPSPDDFEAFTKACEAETRKIQALQSDLDSTRSRMAEEQAALTQQSLGLNEAIVSLNRRLTEVLEPQSRTSEAELTELMAVRSQRSLAFALAEELRDLQTRAVSLEGQSKVKHAKQPKANVDLAPFESFALVVEGLLREWQYPGLQRVTFDQKGLDVIVSGRARGGRGKGYRGITHAAFTIGLMRYCRQKGLPHPGVVILDSPLVTLKEPPQPGIPAPSPTPPGGDTSADAAEEIPLSMKDAFYRSLANEPNGDQIIILENDPPPPEVEDITNIVRFTKIEGIGRYGLFPI